MLKIVLSYGKNQWLLIIYLFIAELPVEFISPLGDYRVMEKSSITLECEVSKPNKTASWLKNGEVMEPSDRIVMRVEGTKHYLTINDSVLDDEDKYTIRVDEAESTGKLTVDGKSRISCTEKIT